MIEKQYHAMLKKSFPEIVCLCGSTRFKKEYEEANEQFTLEGKIVLSVGCFKNTKTGINEKQLDELHLRKIDLANFIFVINVKGYIGESTEKEIEYAKKTKTPIFFLEPDI